jgi:drug/metabolite transporter (DMT)-like permease
VALALLAAIGFSVGGIGSNLAFEAGVAPLAFVAARAVLGAAAIGAPLLLLRRWASVRALSPTERRWLLIATAANAMVNALSFVSFSLIPIAIAIAIYYLYPAVLAAAAAVTGEEPLTRRRVASMALQFGGLALILGPAAQLDGSLDPAGVAIAFGAALAEAAFFTISRRRLPSVPDAQAASVTLLGGLAPALAGAWLLGVDLVGWVDSPEAWTWVLVAALLGAALPQIAIIGAVRRVGGVRAGTVMLLEPGITAVLAAAVLGQPLTAGLAAGIALVVVGAAGIRGR